MAIILNSTTKPKAIERLRLARYGNDAERSEGARWIQNEGKFPVADLFSEGYINAYWAVWNYLRDNVNGDTTYLQQIASVEDESGTMTTADYATSQLEPVSTHVSAHHQTSTNQNREWVLNTLIISDPYKVMQANPEFLPALATLYLANDPDVLESVRNYYPDLETVVQNYIQEKAATATTSTHTGSGSSSVSSSVHSGTSHSVATTGSHSEPATTANYGTNPYSMYFSSNGQAYLRNTTLNPNAGSWSFTLNNGETVTTTDYDEALIIEAALYNIGKGPKPGATSWSFNGRTVYTYAEAWDAYLEALNNEFVKVNNAGNAATGGQLNNSALISAQTEYDEPNSSGTTTTKTTLLRTNTNSSGTNTPAEAEQKSNLKWWLIGGGAALVLGVGIYLSRKNKKSKK